MYAIGTLSRKHFRLLHHEIDPMNATPFFKAAWTLFLKDLRIEFRSRELVSAMGLFALLSVFAFSFALELERATLQTAAAGIFWVTVVFAVMLGLSRSLAAEREQGNLDALLLAPMDRSAIFVGKLLANLLFGVIVGLLLMPIMTVLYNVPLLDIRLLAVLILGTLALTAVGTLLAAMTVQTRARETLLPILMLPTALPVLTLVVRASNGIMQVQPEELWISVLPILVLLDMVYGVMCFLLFPYVLED